MITPILAALIIVIVAAKASGWISVRLGQPAVLGELLAGLVLGPSLLGVFAIPYFAEAHVTELLIELGEIGVILLMFVAGMDVHLEDMIKTGKPAVLAGDIGRAGARCADLRRCRCIRLRADPVALPRAGACGDIGQHLGADADRAGRAAQP